MKAMKLADVPQGGAATVEEVACSPRERSRLAPLGIVQGVGVEVLRNVNRGAVLVEVRNTLVAMSRAVAEGIVVKGER